MSVTSLWVFTYAFTLSRSFQSVMQRTAKKFLQLEHPTAKKFLRFYHAAAKKFLRFPGLKLKRPSISCKKNFSCGRKKKFLCVHYFWAVLYGNNLPPLYKYFTSTVFIENSTFTVIIKLLHHWETPVQMSSRRTMLLFLLFCSFSILFHPLFSLEAAVSVFASTSSASMFLNSSLKTVPKNHNLAFHQQMALRTPFLCSFQHFSVSINSFYGNKDYKLAGNFKLLATKLFTCETSVTMDTFCNHGYVSQVERIEILIRRGLISLQFHLSLK